MKLWVVYEEWQDGDLNHEYFLDEQKAQERYNYLFKTGTSMKFLLNFREIETED